MNFNEFYKDITEYEADHTPLLRATLLNAWRAGASAMLERLIKLGYISQNYELLAREEVKDLVEDKE